MIAMRTDISFHALDGTTLRGWFYPAAAMVLGVALLWQSALLLARAQRGLTDAALKPMRLFHWTNSYLALLFVAAAVDTLIR